MPSILEDSIDYITNDQWWVKFFRTERTLNGFGMVVALGFSECFDFQNWKLCHGAVTEDTDSYLT